jgi:hypothetical protein
MGYAYVLNSFSSNDGIDAESTNWSCIGGSHNGVYTVCYYVDNLLPNTYVKFPVKPLGANGLHVQASPDSNPTGSYDLQSCMITLNTATGSISLQPWGGPNAADAADIANAAGGDKPTEVQAKSPAVGKQRQPAAAAR